MSNVPRAWKSFSTHPMALQRDVGQVEAHLGPFGDSVNLDASKMHGLRRTFHRLENHF